MIDKTIVFIDDGFLAKLSRYFGGGKYIKFDRIKFAVSLSEKQDLECKQIFYYTAPPYQSPKPTNEEANRYRDYERFIQKLSQNELISIREGRCQKFKTKEGAFVFKQKAVDPLVIIDLMSVPIEHKEIRKVILIASDSDFVPAVEYLKKLGIEIILYTYYAKKRDTGLSRSNYLLNSVSRYIKLTKEDFLNAKLDNT